MTAMLMQAQERKSLVTKLVNLKGHVDQRSPRVYTHVINGKISQRNVEVRKINKENQLMLKKIMNIMHRRPQGNGLDALNLKRTTSATLVNEDTLGEASLSPTNNDISLMHSNLGDLSTTKKRHALEVDTADTRESNHLLAPTYDSQRCSIGTYGPNTEAQGSMVDTSHQTSANRLEKGEDPSARQLHQESLQATSVPLEVESEMKESSMEQRLQTDASIYKKDVITTANNMFENFSKTESESSLAHTHSHAVANPGEPPRTADISVSVIDSGVTELQDMSSMQVSKPSPLNKLPPAQKRLFPGQITLNHGYRKKEVARINRENLLMLKALKDVKPCVQGSLTWQKNAVKQQQLRRNISKFRNVGNSQPRPRLQQIASLDSNEDELKPQTDMKSFLPEVVTSRKADFLARKTSQGYRGVIEEGNTMSVPVSQRVHYRNQRVAFNTATAGSDYTALISSKVGHESLIEGDPDASTRLSPSHAVDQSITQEQPSVSASIQKPGSRPGQQSYLQHLKKSPLIASMGFNNFPKSIVNRVMRRAEGRSTTAARFHGQNRNNVCMPKIPLAHQPRDELALTCLPSRHSRRKSSVLDVAETDEPQIDVCFNVESERSTLSDKRIDSAPGLSTPQEETLRAKMSKKSSISPIDEEEISASKDNKIQIQDETAGPGSIGQPDHEEAARVPSEYTSVSFQGTQKSEAAHMSLTKNKNQSTDNVAGVEGDGEALPMGSQVRSERRVETVGQINEQSSSSKGRNNRGSGSSFAFVEEHQIETGAILEDRQQPSGLSKTHGSVHSRAVDQSSIRELDEGGDYSEEKFDSLSKENDKGLIFQMQHHTATNLEIKATSFDVEQPSELPDPYTMGAPISKVNTKQSSVTVLNANSTQGVLKNSNTPSEMNKPQLLTLEAARSELPGQMAAPSQYSYAGTERGLAGQNITSGNQTPEVTTNEAATELVSHAELAILSKENIILSEHSSKEQ